jgi:hypothetical protein
MEIDANPLTLHPTWLPPVHGSTGLSWLQLLLPINVLKLRYSGVMSGSPVDLHETQSLEAVVQAVDCTSQPIGHRFSCKVIDPPGHVNEQASVQLHPQHFASLVSTAIVLVAPQAQPGIHSAGGTWNSGLELQTDAHVSSQNGSFGSLAVAPP